VIRYLAGQFARPSGLLGRVLIGPWLDRISREMNRQVLRALAIGPDDDLLEVGFGGGALLAAMLPATGGEVIGVDLSETMVRRARRRFRGRARLRLLRASAEKLPLANGSADKAASVNSLYFWPDPPAALAELARVIRPGGRLVLAFEPPEELRKWRGHRFGFRLFEVREVEALMAAAGFVAISVAWGRGRNPDLFCVLSGTRGGANG
jgi:arsenite methyltransferase